MQPSVPDICDRAFASAEWRTVVDSLREASGVNVWVADSSCERTHSSTTQCAYCRQARSGAPASPGDCFDRPLKTREEATRNVCVAGLASLSAPVVHKGATVAWVFVSGFITSTRERRALLERALARGSATDAAQRDVGSIPVLTRRQAQGYLQVAAATAVAVVESTAQRLTAAKSVEELRLFLTAGDQVVSAVKMDQATLEIVTEEAVAIVGGVSGAVLRPRGPYLEVVACTEGWRKRVGSKVLARSTAAGQALENRKGLFGPSEKDIGQVLAVPLLVGNRAIGVLEVKCEAEQPPVARDLSRLSRFTRFLAVTLDREDERTRVARAMNGYTELNRLAAALGAQTDAYAIIDTVLTTFARSLSFDVCGIILNGWGKDSVNMLTRPGVDPDDIEELVRHVSGRDLRAHPFAEYEADLLGEECAPYDSEEDWATTSFELSFGELTLGWVFAARTAGERYSLEDRALLEGLAAHVGPAFARAALFARIRDDYEAALSALRQKVTKGKQSIVDDAAISLLLERMTTAEASGFDMMRLWPQEFTA